MQVCPLHPAAVWMVHSYHPLFSAGHPPSVLTSQASSCVLACAMPWKAAGEEQGARGTWELRVKSLKP